MQFGSGSYGHLVDPLFFPVPLPPMVQNPYFFYTKSNTEFTLEGYGLEFNGTPVPLAFQDADEVLFLPATFGNDDSSTFKLDFSLAGNRVKQEGYRKTVVDGHGTIETPYTTSPVQCLRVRSFVDEIDTIETGGTVIGIPRTYVDYKWLAENEKFPLLWVRTEVVAGSEQIVLISFRDHYRPSLGIASLTPSLTRLEAWPVPATNEVNISLPTDWKQYLLTVYDLNGRPITTQSNSPVINLEALPAGTYIIRAVSGTESGFTTVTKR